VPPAPPLWQVQRPPGRRLIAWLVLLATVWLVATFALARMLMVVDRPWLAALIAIALTAVLLMEGLAGAHARVDASGMLTYGFGRRANLRVPLAAVTGWKEIATGALAGIGAVVDPAAVTFLHRKGLSPRRLRDDAGRLGVALVLEHLVADDLAMLRALQLRLTGTAAPVIRKKADG